VVFIWEPPLADDINSNQHLIVVATDPRRLP
jgi:hypothetical protein